MDKSGNRGFLKIAGVMLFGFAISGCNLKEKRILDSILFDGQIFHKDNVRLIENGAPVSFLNTSANQEKKSALDNHTTQIRLFKTRNLVGQYKNDRTKELISMSPVPVRNSSFEFLESDLLETLILEPVEYYKQGRKIKTEKTYDLYFRKVSNCGLDKNYFRIQHKKGVEKPKMYLFEVKVTIPDAPTLKFSTISKEQARLRKEFRNIDVCKLV